MTTLSTHPLDPDQLDLLTLVADTDSPTGLVRMTDFKAACWNDAMMNNGEVHPSRVSALLHQQFGEINPRSLSAKWAPACGPNGFLDKTSELVQIDPTHSKGNGNKGLVLRRWREWPGDAS